MVEDKSQKLPLSFEERQRQVKESAQKLLFLTFRAFTEALKMTLVVMKYEGSLFLIGVTLIALSKFIAQIETAEAYTVTVSIPQDVMLVDDTLQTVYTGPISITINDVIRGGFTTVEILPEEGLRYQEFEGVLGIQTEEERRFEIWHLHTFNPETRVFEEFAVMNGTDRHSLFVATQYYGKFFISNPRPIAANLPDVPGIRPSIYLVRLDQSVAEIQAPEGTFALIQHLRPIIS
jgi:hypothetical protein